MPNSQDRLSIDRDPDQDNAVNEERNKGFVGSYDKPNRSHIANANSTSIYSVKRQKSEVFRSHIGIIAFCDLLKNKIMPNYITFMRKNLLSSYY